MKVNRSPTPTTFSPLQLPCKPATTLLSSSRAAPSNARSSTASSSSSSSRCNSSSSESAASTSGSSEETPRQRQKRERSSRRVVVTGLGVVSSLGHEHTTFYDNLLEGRSGISEIEGFDASEFTTRFAGEIKSLDAGPYIIKKLEKRVDKCIKYILVSGKKALADAGLPHDGSDIKQLDLSRCGILVGTAFGGLSSFSNAVEALAKSGHRKMNPFCIPFAITNMGGAMLAMDTGFMGPNYSISTACATGNYCIMSSYDHIQKGDADLMLAGAADAAIVPSGVGGFMACKALSKRNSDPTGASRPWDTERDGFVMGEGGGVLVLEELSHAQARGATIYAEILGGGLTCDAYHMTDPHPDGKGVSLALRRALENAGIPASRSMIGHLLGGASGIEAVATVKAIQTGWLHPTINLTSPEAGVDLTTVVANTKQQHKVDVALSNSFGFGGHNSAVLFSAFEG
ncbi:MAG: hypothetical protein WDW36_007099 [Sanguina aurantia]